MKFDRVTITGADDGTEMNDLFALSQKYPFVEWGILASESQAGRPRYPGRHWMGNFQQGVLLRDYVKSSLHLCGAYVHQLLIGNNIIPYRMDVGFQRIQLNFHAQKYNCDPFLMFRELKEISNIESSIEPHARQFIFQIDGSLGNRFLEGVYQNNNAAVHVDAVPLFDISSGCGILPTEWPKPIYRDHAGAHCYHGYAGGLGPDNLAEQIPLIADRAGDCRFWIDMETKVRSDDDTLFDLAKVERCLEICKPFITT